ncbi:hypothetical protein ISCGN_015859 [Ixodes scapularis]
MPCGTCNKDSFELWRRTTCRHSICNPCLTKSKELAACCQIKTAIRCPGSKFGCSFVTCSNNWGEHYAACNMVPVTCPQSCQYIVAKKDLSWHQSFECPRRPGNLPFSAVVVASEEARPGGGDDSSAQSRRIHSEEDIKRKKTDRSSTPQSCPSAEEKRMVGSWDKPLCDQLGIEESAFLFRLFKERLQELNFDVETIKRDTRVANLEDEMRELLREKEREIEKLHLRVREQDVTIEAMRSELDTCKTLCNEQVSDLRKQLEAVKGSFDTAVDGLRKQLGDRERETRPFMTEMRLFKDYVASMMEVLESTMVRISPEMSLTLPEESTPNAAS